jgi:hypothetical protein
MKISRNIRQVATAKSRRVITMTGSAIEANMLAAVTHIETLSAAEKRRMSPQMRERLELVRQSIVGFIVALNRQITGPRNRTSS